jgi:hypothetical protein
MYMPCICRRSTYTWYIPGIFQAYTVTENRISRWHCPASHGGSCRSGFHCRLCHLLGGLVAAADGAMRSLLRLANESGEAVPLNPSSVKNRRSESLTQGPGPGRLQVLALPARPPCGSPARLARPEQPPGSITWHAGSPAQFACTPARPLYCLHATAGGHGPSLSPVAVRRTVRMNLSTPKYPNHATLPLRKPNAKLNT